MDYDDSYQTDDGFNRSLKRVKELKSSESEYTSVVNSVIRANRDKEEVLALIM